MTSRPEDQSWRPLLYAVVFEMDESSYSDALPILVDPDGSADDATLPHGLSREVARALPALWYCVHLPNFQRQLGDIPIVALKGAQRLSLAPHILLTPAKLFTSDQLDVEREDHIPVLAICSDESFERAADDARRMGFLIESIKFSQLTNDRLASHWREIHERLRPEAKLLPPPILTKRLDLGPIDLPRRLLERQLLPDDTKPREPGEGEWPAELVKAFDVQILLAALATLEQEQTPPEEARIRLPDQLQTEGQRLRVPVSIGLPGVAGLYTRRVYKKVTVAVDDVNDSPDGWSLDIASGSDATVERAAIELITTHQAVTSSGVGLVLPPVPPSAFSALFELEQHFAARRPSGRAVARLLRRLDEAAGQMWSDEVVGAILSASRLTFYTNFPVGLLRLPGDSGPLLERAPVTYRPLLPLTRALQHQLSFSGMSALAGERLSVLVAECIPETDPVGQISRLGWRAAASNARDGKHVVDVDLVDGIRSEEELRRVIAERRPHVLVLSAHGFYEHRTNLAGLIVGDSLTTGIGLGPLPDLVILSACNVTPRGAGAVNVAELMLREGATAVLGAQIPIDVRRNVMLMNRLFLYIALSMTGEEPYETVLDVWHFVQMSNAINDILLGNRNLYDFGQSLAASGRPVLVEFMQDRSAGRLRQGHLHQDSERVLEEIAGEVGRSDQVRNWLRDPGYVPESLFYLFIGRPEQIRLRLPSFGTRAAAETPPTPGV
jgi:hypothetical protein